MSKLISYAFCVVVAALVIYAFSPRSEQDLDTAHLDLGRIQINDLIRVDDALVAVGERGTILKSNDGGDTWNATSHEVDIPATLTNVSQISDQVLLATGHDSLILRSTDNGDSWEPVMHDLEIGEPLLGTWSPDGSRVYAYGSFGKFFQSDDAGQTWQAMDLPIQGEHLNDMAGEGNLRIIVGEMGLVVRSTDAGESWESLEPFYNGSLFGVANLGNDAWVAYGMRGNVFYSQDNGLNWAQITIPHKMPLYGHALANDGSGLVIVGTGGAYVSIDDQGKLVDTGFLKGLGTLTSAVTLPDGELFVAGQRGLLQGSQDLLAVIGK